MNAQQEFVLRSVEENDIRFVRLWFTDVLGQLKSVAIAPAELEDALEEGIGFDGSAVEGLTRVSEDDMLVKPDASTFQILPMEGADKAGLTARMFCDVLTPEGEPSLGDSRHVLKMALDKAKEKGFSFYCHPEIEFYLFEQQSDWTRPPVPIDEGGYFDQVPRSSSMDFRRAAVSQLEQLGIPVEFSHHEAGPGQNEIDLRHADALATADNVMTFKTLVKEISLDRGIYASFMPKPLVDQPGSGMHTHLSLFEGDSNAFYEAGEEFNMSRTARQFAAGILYHAQEITAVMNQYVNSYKRLWGGAEAPSYVCWGHNNRSALLRIPQYKPGKTDSARIEFRALDPTCNPYLAFALLLACGVDGIDKQMELEEPTTDDVWDLTDGERMAMGIQPLPGSLDSALKQMEKSDFVAQILGEHVFEYFLRNKHAEWRQYRQQVTQYELAQYLPRL
ncbi:glutamine synthetase [Parascardovia denticolens IPLA 20019]|uniref:type I glutamate--ammonia ligase n=1 Tax=Parascardovia denticolens TaxID=78258 RepID=UPI000266E99F|nr:type I glutamate--ammonia ligase [Parascardovia denticolens]EIT87722.1 glutamine synthetase [Parascardovia denticolens IPLA 20019]